MYYDHNNRIKVKKVNKKTTSVFCKIISPMHVIQLIISNNYQNTFLFLLVFIFNNQFER